MRAALPQATAPIDLKAIATVGADSDYSCNLFAVLNLSPHTPETQMDSGSQKVQHLCEMYICTIYSWGVQTDI